MFYGATEFNKNINNWKLDLLMNETLEASRQIKEIMKNTKINKLEQNNAINTHQIQKNYMLLSKQYNIKNISIQSHVFNVKDIIAKNTRLKLLSFNNYKRTFNSIMRIIK